MNKYKELYSVELFLIISYFLVKIISPHYYYIDFVFYLIWFVIFYFKFGYPRNKNYLNRISIRYMIILLLTYLLIIYFLGCFTGFFKSVYNHSLLGIIVNVVPSVLLILSKEMIRYSIATHSKLNVKPLIGLTIVFIVMSVFNSYMNTPIQNVYQLFNFVCVTLIPTIASEMMCSYVVYHVSVYPSLIYQLSLGIVPLLVPIYPDLGNYLNAILQLLFPYFIYTVIKKIVTYKEKSQIITRNYMVKTLGVIGTLLLAILIVLISGIFNYKMIAIGSNSMNPVYYRGDAVIYKKVQSDQIKKNDILVFESNKTVVTHRVIDIIEEDGILFFKTKGDYNQQADPALVSQKEVLGKVCYIVKYMGYPTIWFNEVF